MSKPLCTVWSSGLSAAGKSTIAERLLLGLRDHGITNVEVLDGDESGEAVALSLGLVDNSHKNLRVSGRVETRQADASDYYAINYTYAARINLKWSILYKDQLNFEKMKTGEDMITRDVE